MTRPPTLTAPQPTCASPDAYIVYDSFGRTISETNASVGTNYGYTGRERDRESGLYYYRARYYDTANGKFLSEDPLGLAAGDPNLYRYVSNNPTVLIDPLGLTPETPNRRPFFPVLSDTADETGDKYDYVGAGYAQIPGGELGGVFTAIGHTTAAVQHGANAFDAWLAFQAGSQADFAQNFDHFASGAVSDLAGWVAFSAITATATLSAGPAAGVAIAPIAVYYQQWTENFFQDNWEGSWAQTGSQEIAEWIWRNGRPDSKPSTIGVTAPAGSLP